MKRELQFSIRNERAAALAQIVGDIDLGTFPALRKTLFETLSGTERLAVNMTQVRYIDSSGIATLFEVLQQARKVQKRLILFGLNASVLKVLQLTRLTG